MTMLIEKEYSKLDHPDVLRFIFHPRAEQAGTTPTNCTDHAIPVSGGVTIGGRFHMAAAEAPHILFFHGNGETVRDYDDVGSMYNQQNMTLLAVDYRGYGWSTGTPTVTAMQRDAHDILQYVRDWMQSENRTGPLLVMGRSLGSAPALELAAMATNNLAGLIIESGFAHTVPLLNCLGVDVKSLEITEEEGFGNQEKIAHFTKSTLILHAQNDQIIPVGDAGDLQAECGARNKEFQMVPGADHNTIIQRTGRMYFEVIGRFTKKLGEKPRRSRMGVRG